MSFTFVPRSIVAAANPSSNVEGGMSNDAILVEGLNGTSTSNTMAKRDGALNYSTALTPYTTVATTKVCIGIQNPDGSGNQVMIVSINLTCYMFYKTSAATAWTANGSFAVGSAVKKIEFSPNGLYFYLLYSAGPSYGVTIHTVTGTGASFTPNTTLFQAVTSGTPNDACWSPDSLMVVVGHTTGLKIIRRPVSTWVVTDLFTTGSYARVAVSSDGLHLCTSFINNLKLLKFLTTTTVSDISSTITNPVSGTIGAMSYIGADFIFVATTTGAFDWRLYKRTGLTDTYTEVTDSTGYTAVSARTIKVSSDRNTFMINQGGAGIVVYSVVVTTDIDEATIAWSYGALTMGITGYITPQMSVAWSYGSYDMDISGYSMPEVSVAWSYGSYDMDITGTAQIGAQVAWSYGPLAMNVGMLQFVQDYPDAVPTMFRGPAISLTSDGVTLTEEQDEFAVIAWSYGTYDFAIDLLIKEKDLTNIAWSYQPLQMAITLGYIDPVDIAWSYQPYRMSILGPIDGDIAWSYQPYSFEIDLGTPALPSNIAWSYGGYIFNMELSNKFGTFVNFNYSPFTMEWELDAPSGGTIDWSYGSYAFELEADVQKPLTIAWSYGNYDMDLTGTSQIGSFIDFAYAAYVMQLKIAKSDEIDMTYGAYGMELTGDAQHGGAIEWSYGAYAFDLEIEAQRNMDIKFTYGRYGTTLTGENQASSRLTFIILQP
jgi:hypothetical protein